jgi:hypothetical protein
MYPQVYPAPRRDMNFIDIWTIATGLASIISLIIVLSDRFPEWKRYLIPAGCFLGGFTMGRIFTGIMPITKEWQDQRIVGFIIIIVILLGFYLYILKLLSKMGDEFSQFMMFFVILGGLIIFSLGIPALFNNYMTHFESIPKADYLLLADIKEKSKDNESAIKYLKKYEGLTSDEEIKNTIEKKIHILKDKLITIEEKNKKE